MSLQKEGSTSSSPTPRGRVQGDENENDEFPPLQKQKFCLHFQKRFPCLPKSSLKEPHMEKGIAKLEYEISDSGGDVCHGSLSGACVSFIQFDNSEKAQMSKSLLQGLRSGEFVYPLMVISNPKVWLVTEKIDSTLDQFKEKNIGIWSRDYLLDYKYKIIVRDIIAAVNQLVNQASTGELKIQDIAIINGRAKLMRISNELVKRDQLRNLLEGLLGNNPDNEELIDFYSQMKTMPMSKLIHLRNHPILLTSKERLQFPVSLLRLLNSEKKSSKWKTKYDDQYEEEEVTKAKRLKKKDQEYNVVYMVEGDPNSEVNYIATKVEKDQEYKKVYGYRFYPNTASSQIYFSRNVIVHINDDGKCRTEEEVGKKLRHFFPDLWTRMFSFMIWEGIDVWDQHNNEKCGGDLLSHWGATLKLCILENDDLATEHFLKICRSFFSLIVMKADKGGAISTLVDKIKEKINTVESKFLQDQFKYRKLEGIFNDDNVCSTSTKLAENSCTNCINFLMRILKFIALLLHQYALNADGDVRGMFETAYSSLLKDDPDSKKKKKKERKEESPEKQRNLLESAPSNEEFKSLLGNPENIKDCAKV